MMYQVSWRFVLGDTENNIATILGKMLRGLLLFVAGGGLRVLTLWSILKF